MKHSLLFLLFHTLLLSLFFFEGNQGLPALENGGSFLNPATFSRHSFKGFYPTNSVKSRHTRADEGNGVGGFLQTAVQDGISASSAFTSPTLFLGGFSMMMQPMPNGTEFSGQLVNAMPHYLSMLSSLPGLSNLG